MTEASSTATTHDFPDVGQAALNIAYMINVYQSAEKPKDLTAQTDRDLEAQVRELENTLVEQNKVPLTHAFKCHQDHRACMDKANSNIEKRVCYLTFMACLGTEITTFFKRGD